MKKILLTALMISATFTFIGCSSTKKPISNDDFIVTINDNSQIKEFENISDGSFEIDIDSSSGEKADKSDSSKGKLSYSPKTIELEGASVSIPKDWEELELNSSIFYVFNDTKCTANFVVEDMQGLTSEKYMELAEKSVKEYLNVDKVYYSSKTVNGVKIDMFEYVQISDSISVYTYQPTIFKDGKAYILTLGAADKASLDEYKNLGCEIVTTIK